MELVIVILVVVHCLEKVIANLQRVICEKKTGCWYSRKLKISPSLK